MDIARFNDIDVDEAAERELFENTIIFDRIQDALRCLIWAYASEPSKVEIYRGVRGRQMVFKILLSSKDVGMVVGKGGKNIHTLSDAFKPIAARDNFGISLEVIDRDAR